MAEVVQRLGLEPAREEVPSWFRPGQFLENDFSPERYVSDLRRQVPLEMLSQQLETYLTTLKNKLVEVINQDYNDFISLSSKLINVDGAVMRMRMSLLTVKEGLVVVQGYHAYWVWQQIWSCLALSRQPRSMSNIAA
ncbi:hypothetical protein WJX84_010713 [Apatococcus fuscideae]|uniref:Conserved oligomeric Golgi complex subunit 2 n=1 Tax=Apatococcus fuscideae TaxID=2026836 RepID=A0AAW1T4G1_9CHLO